MVNVCPEACDESKSNLSRPSRKQEDLLHPPPGYGVSWTKRRPVMMLSAHAFDFSPFWVYGYKKVRSESRAIFILRSRLLRGRLDEMVFILP